MMPQEPRASRVTYVCGRAVQKAGEQLLDKIKNACLALYGWEKEKPGSFGWRDYLPGNGEKKAMERSL